jgi:hypothetical protein
MMKGREILITCETKGTIVPLGPRLMKSAGNRRSFSESIVTCYLGSHPIKRFVARQQLRKYATILQALLGSRSSVTMEIQLEEVFSMWSAPRLYHASDSSILVQFQELTSCEQCSVKKESPAQNLQLCFNCFIRRLAFVCYKTRYCMLYLLCVISAIVQINFLVKSGESTFIVATCR